MMNAEPAAMYGVVGKGQTVTFCGSLEKSPGKYNIDRGETRIRPHIHVPGSSSAFCVKRGAAVSSRAARWTRNWSARRRHSSAASHPLSAFPTASSKQGSKAPLPARASSRTAASSSASWPWWRGLNEPGGGCGREGREPFVEDLMVQNFEVHGLWIDSVKNKTPSTPARYQQGTGWNLS